MSATIITLSSDTLTSRGRKLGQYPTYEPVQVVRLGEMLSIALGSAVTVTIDDSVGHKIVCPTGTTRKVQAVLRAWSDAEASERKRAFSQWENETEVRLSAECRALAETFAPVKKSKRVVGGVMAAIRAAESE